MIAAMPRKISIHCTGSADRTNFLIALAYQSNDHRSGGQSQRKTAIIAPTIGIFESSNSGAQHQISDNWIQSQSVGGHG